MTNIETDKDLKRDILRIIKKRIKILKQNMKFHRRNGNDVEADIIEEIVDELTNLKKLIEMI